MTKQEKTAAAKAEAIAKSQPDMAARMLTTIHRAGSTKTQGEVEQILSRLNLFGFTVRTLGGVLL